MARMLRQVEWEWQSIGASWKSCAVRNWPPVRSPLSSKRTPRLPRPFEKLICHTASRHIPFQQVLGAQHRPLENEHRPPSGMQVCRPALATEVKGVKKTPITINRAPAIFNNEVLFIFFPLSDTNYYATAYIEHSGQTF